MLFTYLKKRCIFCFISWPLILKTKIILSFTCPKTIWRPAAPEPRGLSKNLKTWENSSYKNDFIFYNLTSQSKDKAYNHCLRKYVKIPPPLFILVKSNFHWVVDHYYLLCIVISFWIQCMVCFMDTQKGQWVINYFVLKKLSLFYNITILDSIQPWGGNVAVQVYYECYARRKSTCFR